MKFSLITFTLAVSGAQFLKFLPSCSEKYDKCQNEMATKMSGMVSMCHEMGILGTSLGVNQLEICRDMLRSCGQKMDKMTAIMQDGATETLKAKKCQLKAAIPGLYPDLPCLTNNAVNFAAHNMVPDEYLSDCPSYGKPECPHVCACAENLQKVQHHHSLIDGYYSMLQFEKQFCEQAARSSTHNIPEQCQISAVCH